MGGEVPAVFGNSGFGGHVSFRWYSPKLFSGPKHTGNDCITSTSAPPAKLDLVPWTAPKKGNGKINLTFLILVRSRSSSDMFLDISARCSCTIFVSKLFCIVENGLSASVGHHLKRWNSACGRNLRLYNLLLFLHNISYSTLDYFQDSLFCYFFEHDSLHTHWLVYCVSYNFNCYLASVRYSAWHCAMHQM